MKKNLLLLILILVAFDNYQSFGQQLKRCYTDEATNAALLNNPDAISARKQLEKFTEEYIKDIQQKGNQKVQGIVYVIPVVFHVLHTWGAENISDAQIYDEIRILNRDYRKLNADTSLVVPAFQGIIADIEFEFRLAHIDPNGNCTNGIIRHEDPRTDWVQSGTTVYPYTWNPTKYLNIYSVKSITGGSGNIAAYTYVPSTWPTGNAHDAIVSLSGYVGSIGTGTPGNSRTLTHEIGHWFNLYHPWGTTNQPGVACGGTDYVGDTPETRGSIVGVCNLTLSYCNPPVVENVQNYMDYSYCDVMFTEGQKTRMRAAAASGTNGRNNLWSVTNLTATGTDGTPVACLPIPYMNGALRTICEGGSLIFKHFSMNLDTAPPATVLWTFPGGTPGTSSINNPVITYPTAGHYDVTLTITNAAGSSTVTYPSAVSVYSTTASVQAPYAEGFETVTFPGTDFDIDNSNNGNTWTQTNLAAATGSQSVYINNFGGNGGSDVFITPSYSFSNVTSPTMTFKVAFAQRNASLGDDKLQVYGSINCGQSWVQRYIKSGSTLATSGVVANSAFTPTLASQWRQESANIAIYANEPNIRFKFVYTYSTTGNFGNNIYVDDINLNGITGINNTLADELSMWLSPNPAANVSELSFTLKKESTVEVKVIDRIGRTCSHLAATRLQPGDHNFEIGKNLNPGIYMVELISDGNKALRRLMIE